LIVYPIGASGQALVLSDTVIEYLENHRQIEQCSAEAGGQLFASFVAREVRIEEATGPRPTDKRGHTFYRPDRRAERKEIKDRYKLGLHYIGDWHTHPSARPEASSTDLRNIKECFVRSQHELNGFVLVIVGTSPAPEGLRVSVNDGINDFVLREEDS
jgi:integrative and conjugative element protein (TIGR02256 family)